MDTGGKGLIAHTLAVGKLTLLGYNVSLPVGQLRYDLVIEKDGKFSRCQVKYVGTRRAGKLVVKFYSSPRSGSRRKMYTQSEIDVILVYWAEEGRWFWVDLGNVTGGQSRMTLDLRIDPVRSGNGSGVKWAKDFEV